jgi:hypothetical protein
MQVNRVKSVPETLAVRSILRRLIDWKDFNTSDYTGSVFHLTTVVCNSPPLLRLACGRSSNDKRANRSWHTIFVR